MAYTPGSPSSATEREQELGVAAAAPLASDGDGRLAAREQHARPRSWLAVAHHLARDAGMHQGHLARFALQAVAEDERRDAGLARYLCRGLQRLLGRRDHCAWCRPIVDRRAWASLPRAARKCATTEVGSVMPVLLEHRERIGESRTVRHGGP